MAAQRNEHQTGVKNGDITKEGGRFVLPGGKQHGREEAPQHAQHRHDQGVEPDGQENKPSLSPAP